MSNSQVRFPRNPVDCLLIKFGWLQISASGKWALAALIVIAVVPQNVSRRTSGPRKRNSELGRGGWSGVAFVRQWQSGKYRRFAEDAVPWRQVGRIKRRVCQSSASMRGSACRLRSCGVGGSRIRSIVKGSILRVAGEYRHASTVDLVVGITTLVDQTRGRATATRSG
jgi:hypothetical protein